MFGILATIIRLFSLSNASKLFVQYPDLSDVIYLTGIIGDANGISLTTCALYCERYNCLSFSHSIETGFCRLHTLKFPPCFPSPWMIKVPTVYTAFYRVKDGDKLICPCKLDLNDGTWTVMQQRFNGVVDFMKDWKAYKEGFGDGPDGEFWLGLETVYQMTRSSKYVLVVELEDKDGVRGCASFDEFSIGPEGEGYRLDAWKYQGTAGNSLGYHTGNRFSTLDQDNDQRPSSIKNCADEYGGGGNWYKSCVVQNLNGLYLQLPGRADTMVWKTFRNFTGLKKSKMLLKKYSEVYD